MNTKVKKPFSWGTLAARICMILASILVLVPFLMLFLTATKTNEEFYAGIWTLPHNIFQSLPENLSQAWAEAQMGIGYFNSVIVSVLALILTLAMGAMAAYEIGRRHLKHETFFSNYFLVGLLVPAMVGLTPSFYVARALGLFDTRTILVIMYTAMEIPFTVFVMTSFARSIPSELEEAAYIDGASLWKAFLTIILPLMRPAFVAAGIFAFLDNWSEYMYGLMFLVTPAKKTVAMNILQFKVGTGVKVNWGVTTGACVIFILPVLIVYVIFQDKIMGGLTAGSVKG